MWKISIGYHFDFQDQLNGKLDIGAQTMAVGYGLSSL